MKEIKTETYYRDTDDNILWSEEKSFEAKDPTDKTKPIEFKGMWNKNYTVRNPEYSCKNFLANFYILTKHLRDGNYIQSHKRLEGCCPARTQEIIEMLETSQTSFDRFIAESKRKNIIKKVTGQKGYEIYYINPAYHFVGNVMNTTLFAMFVDDEVFRESLTKKALQNWHKEISAYYEVGCNDIKKLDEDFK